MNKIYCTKEVFYGQAANFFLEREKAEKIYNQVLCLRIDDTMLNITNKDLYIMISDLPKRIISKVFFSKKEAKEYVPMILGLNMQNFIIIRGYNCSSNITIWERSYLAILKYNNLILS